MRRTWLRKLVNVTKRYLIAAAAHNLGRVLRKLFGIGKPKSLQGEGGFAALAPALMAWLLVWICPFAKQCADRASVGVHGTPA